MAELRCKPGDLAMMLSTGNTGKIVRVIERAPDWVERLYEAPAWEVMSLGSPIKTYNLMTWEPSGYEMFTRTPDRRLVPLRDSPEPAKKRRKAKKLLVDNSSEA